MVKHKPKIRLYVDKKISEKQEVELSETQRHYLQNVMRLSIGDIIRIFDGISGEYDAGIEVLNKKTCFLQVKEKIKEYVSSPDIWLIFAPVKKEQTDFIIEKSVELGVSKLIPIITDYGISQKINKERYKSRAIEAAEQCRRLDVPQVEDIKSLSDIINNWPQDRDLFFMDESGVGNDIFSVFSQDKRNSKAAILIGPEGGFSPQEMDILHNNAFAISVSMGHRILRAETAAVSALSCWQAMTGDWRMK